MTKIYGLISEPREGFDHILRMVQVEVGFYDGEGIIIQGLSIKEHAEMLERIIGAAENLGITIPGGRKIGVKIPMAGEHPEMLDLAVLAGILAEDGRITPQETEAFIYCGKVRDKKVFALGPRTYDQAKMLSRGADKVLVCANEYIDGYAWIEQTI